MKLRDLLRTGSAAVAASAMLFAVGCEEREEVGTAVPERTEVAQRAEVDEGAQLAAAQTGVRTEEAGENIRQYILYPTGEEESSVLRIEKISPAQVRMGTQYDYQIQVTNLTDAPLAGVRVNEIVPASVEIETSTPQHQVLSGAQAQQAGHAGHFGASVGQGPATRPTGAQQQGMNQQAKPSGQQAQQNQQMQQAQAQQGQQAGQQQARQGQQQAQQGQPQVVQWMVGELGPGQTRTINVTSYVAAAGQIPTCITADYQPTLCTVTNVVNPVLRLGKAAPEVAGVCEQVAWVYTVWNDGTGNLQDVIIRDPLPEGMVTEAGQQIVEIEVGDIEAGTSRDFRVILQPSRTGVFASRAVATSEADEVYSQKVATRIVAADLEVAVRAPEWTYLGDEFEYNVIVRNVGDAPAENAVLTFEAPETVAMIDRPVFGEEAETEGEAELAAAEEAPEGAVRLGVIEPGQERNVRLLFRGEAEGAAQIAAVAQAECALEPARDVARVVMATLPALQLEMIDGQDPVSAGGEIVYAINLINEGTGVANNVQLQAQLPQGMQFIDGEGTTEVRGEGNQIQIAPIPAFEPQAKAEWRIRVRPTQPGNQQFILQVQAANLNQPLIEREPTTVTP